MKIQHFSTKVRTKPKCGPFNITTFRTTKLQVQLNFNEIRHYLPYRNWTGAGYTYT